MYATVSRSFRFSFPAASALVLTALAFSPTARALAPYTAPSGDVNADGTLDGLDIQCEVRTYTQLVLAGPLTADRCPDDAHCVALYGDGQRCRPGFDAFRLCLPDCLAPAVSLGRDSAPACDDPAADDADCLGLVPRAIADLNCDGKINNVDFLFLVAIVMQKLGGPGTADIDGDGKLNFCDDDSDGDGDPDDTDCAVLDPSVGAAGPELCDGRDNDCDGAIDAADPDLVPGPLCALQDGVCAGARAEVCDSGAWQDCDDALYLAHDAAYEPVEQACDGRDNDCDGLIDGDDDDTPAGCAPCATDADCPDGSHCDESVGRCVPDGGPDDPCGEDSDCDDGLHCDDGVCVPDVPDGGDCDEPSDCESGNCVDGVCCAAGGVCCRQPADCAVPDAICDDPAGCQGRRFDATCEGFVCGQDEVEDDSVCGVEIVARDCEPFVSRRCDGTAVQSAPGPCPTDCADDTGCAENAVCRHEVCEPVLCTLSGSAGEWVDCPLHLARGAEALPPAVVLQLTLDYAAAEATPETLRACGPVPPPFGPLACTPGSGDCDVFGDPDVACDETRGECRLCRSWAIDDPDARLAAGHAVSTCAQPPARCNAGAFPLLMWSALSLPVTPAFIDGDTIDGDSELLTVGFRLATDAIDSAVSLSPVELVASDAGANGLPVGVRHGDVPEHVLVTGAPAE